MIFSKQDRKDISNSFVAISKQFLDVTNLINQIVKANLVTFEKIGKDMTNVEDRLTALESKKGRVTKAKKKTK